MRISSLLPFLVICLSAQDLGQLQSLKFREIGPSNMGGRVDDFAVVESNPTIVYAGLASGGVWKTVNGGTTWTPLFDNQPLASIGDITIAPSDPDTVWVGTGEANNRQSSSWGNGVYKSTDGGRTWKHMGLKDTHHIGRIAIHPRDPNIVYVAALGRLWGPNEERGLFKTTDGGKTWNKVLYVNADTGVTDLVMDPESPDTLYAAAYQRRRTAFGFNGGGPGSGLHKTTDGGVTWKKLSTGLPSGELGRIGLDIYRRDPKVLYALVESLESGIYRSDDKGETWRKMSNQNPRPMYFSQVRVDPNNDQRVWVLGVQLFFSDDGGKTFRNVAGPIHVDFHAMWINPANSDHVIAGCDGGIHFTRDRGKTWDSLENIAIGQFYEVGFDMQKPYRVCGGLQDNSTWCGPSASTDRRGIARDEWFTVAGGDGFYAQVDPEEPWIVYGESQDGNLVRRDLRAHESRSIRPREDDDKMPRYRFQWNSPVVLSKHDRKTLYYGGNFVFKSNDQGDTWKRISPDLTTNVERNSLKIFDRPMSDRKVLSRNDGVGNFPTITTLAESNRRAGILWAGTDDGQLHVSRDGETWKNVVDRIPGVPKGTYVSRVVPSVHNEATAYVTFDGHRSNDFGIYIYKTADFGETWKEITAGIPKEGGVVNVVREHPRNASLLFAGGEFGLYVSFNGGDSWRELKNNLPRVPVDDIAIHPRENDLILGTHGRSVWILDSIYPLEQMTARVAESPVHLFDVRPAVSWRMRERRDFTGSEHYYGQNPPYGAILDIHLKAKAEPKDLKILIADKQGRPVRELKADKLEAGLNRIVWDLRADRPVPPTEEEERMARMMAEMGGGPPTALRSGPMVDPGEYMVKVSLAGNEMSKPVLVEEDPRVTYVSQADRQKRREALNELITVTRQVDTLRRKFTAIDGGATALETAWKKPDAPKVPDGVKTDLAALKKKIEEVKPRFVGFNFFAPPPADPKELEKPEPPFRLPTLPQRVQQLTGAIDSFTGAPSAPQLQQLAQLKQLITDSTKQVDDLAAETAKLNRALNQAGVPFINVP